MPTCCQGATCACKVSAVEGGHLIVTGSGQANDPFLLTADVDFTVTDNLTFDMSLDGTGTGGDPWTLSVNFAATARLADFPDVSDTTATTGQVLAWNGTVWAPAAPTTAPAGAVIHGASLTGDGSGGNPLAVVPESARLLQIAAGGVGLSDTGMRSVVRHFTDATARNSATPTPVVNQLSTLDTAPGRLDYWDGTQWAQVLDKVTTVTGTAFLQLSGPYNGVTPITRLVNGAFSSTTDGTGTFTLLSTATLAGRAGVLTVQYQETGATAYRAVLNATGGQVVGKAYALSNGSPLVGAPVTGIYTAYVY